MGKQLDELATSVAQVIQLQNALHAKFDDMAEKFSMQEVAFNHSTQFLEERLTSMEVTISDILHKLPEVTSQHHVYATVEATVQTELQEDVGIVNSLIAAQVETLGIALEGDIASESQSHHLVTDLAHDPISHDKSSVSPLTMSTGPVPQRHSDDVAPCIALDGDIAGGSLLKLPEADSVSVASGIQERGDSQKTLKQDAISGEGHDMEDARIEDSEDEDIGTSAIAKTSDAPPSPPINDMTQERIDLMYQFIASMMPDVEEDPTMNSVQELVRQCQDRPKGGNRLPKFFDELLDELADVKNPIWKSDASSSSKQETQLLSKGKATIVIKRFLLNSGIIERCPRLQALIQITGALHKSQVSAYVIDFVRCIPYELMKHFDSEARTILEDMGLDMGVFHEIDYYSSQQWSSHYSWSSWKY